MSAVRRSALLATVLSAVSVVVSSGYAGAATAAPTANAGPLPPPVEVRQEPEGVTLADPTFEAAPGAHADFGRLGS